MRFQTTLSLAFTAATVLFAQNSQNASLDDLLRNGQWSREFTIAGFTGDDGFAPVVYDFARHPDGSLLAAGRYWWSGNRKIGPLAERRNGVWNSATENWDKQPPDIGFSAVAVNLGGVTALSTNSGPFGAAPAEVWLESGDHVRVIGHFRGSMRSLVWFRGQLWAAGNFQLDEGGIRHLAVWDGEAWSAPSGGSPDRAVYRIVESGESLLFAGDFQSIGGIPAKHIAEWTDDGWRAYSIEDPIAVAHVYAVARTEEGELYAAGAVSGGLIRWNGAGWRPVSTGIYSGEFPGVITDIALSNSSIYVTGCFSHLNAPKANSSAIPAQSVARWTGSQWNSLDDGTHAIGSSWFEWGVCGSEPNEYTIWDVRHQRIYEHEGEFLLGGMFPGVADIPSQTIATYRHNQWHAVGEPRFGLAGAADWVTAGGPDRSVYAMGGITHAGSVERTSGIFRFGGGQWHPVGGPLPTGLSCRGFAVDSGGTVYIGCNTRPPGDAPPTPVVLRQAGDQWTRLDIAGLEGTIWDIRSDGAGRVWLAGGTRTGDATGSGFLVRMDANVPTVVERGFDSMVFRIAFPPTGTPGESPEVLVGGAFTAVGSTHAGRIARWRNGAWEAVGADLPGAVLALAWANDAIYVSTEPAEPPAPRHLLLGRWDGRSWTEVATPENGLPAPREQTVHSIRDLVAHGRHVIAAGSIWPVTGGRNVYVFDGARLMSLGGGVDAISVNSIALASDGLWFGGEIAEVGESEAPVPSVGIARFNRENESSGASR